MNTEDLAKEVQDILKVVGLCPKELQGKCFELLLSDYLAEAKLVQGRSLSAVSAHQSERPKIAEPVTAQALPTEVRKRMEVFAVQFGLTIDKLLDIYHVDELSNVSIEVTDLKSGKTAKRQRRLALLLGGKHQFQDGSFDIPTEELRELCVTYGAYDAANFMANLKNSKEILAGFKPDATNKLSPVGKAELGALLKELTS
jgi:hypothetical protein